MDQKRRDKKGRVLLEGESQRTDGRYSYRFTDGTGARHEIYSWRLTEADKTPAGKKHGLSLREMEHNLGDTSMITAYNERKITMNGYFDRFIKQ